MGLINVVVREVVVIKYISSSLLGLLIGFVPYLFFSTYFWFSCWRADGEGEAKGYAVLNMLPTLQDYYWISVKLSLGTIAGALLYQIIKGKNGN